MLCSDLNLGLLALGATAGLVNHHERVGQAEALTRSTARKQDSGHGSSHAHANSGDLRLDEVHGVEDSQTGRDLAARRIDVDRDVLLGILALQVKQLGNHQVGRNGVDLFTQKDDAIVQQARIDVVAALTARRLLDNVGHERRLNVLHGNSFHTYSIETYGAPDAPERRIEAPYRNTGSPVS